MEEPPKELDGADVFLWTVLSEENERTESVRLFRGNTEQTKFFGLAIAGYSKEGKEMNEKYLFYCNDAWGVENDTLHDSIDEAKEFAESQYTGGPLEWKEVDPTRR